MKPRVYFGIALKIIILFAIGMVGTYIPEHLRSFFGDSPCELTKNWKGQLGYHCSGGLGDIDPMWKWGARHYWYFWMMFCLFILSLINTVVGTVKLIEKNS